MPTLVLQLCTKTWEKSQRGPEDIAARAQLPNAHLIQAKPHFLIFEMPCVLDNHTGRDIKKAMLADGSIKLERFIISPNHELAYQADKQAAEVIGNLNEGWIQAKYEWRYSVEEDSKIFWRYEEVTLNAAIVDDLVDDYFLELPASLSFKVGDK